MGGNNLTGGSYPARLLKNAGILLYIYAGLSVVSLLLHLGPLSSAQGAGPEGKDASPLTYCFQALVSGFCGYAARRYARKLDAQKDPPPEKSKGPE